MPVSRTSDPYACYAEMRAGDPVPLNGTRRVWVLTRYDDVALALRDPCLGRKRIGDLLGADPAKTQLGASMLFEDPPAHTRLRNLLGKAFTPRMIEGLRPRIRKIVDTLLDRVMDCGSMNLIADFAFPLPLYVILELLGVPDADRDLFRQWSLDIAKARDPASASAFESTACAYDLIADYFSSLIAERRKRPQDDLLTALIACQGEGDCLSESALAGVCGLFFFSGHETTVNLIGNGMLALLWHPAELGKLRQNPGCLPDAIEEFLRFDSPVQRAGRIANAHFEIAGKTIPAGTIVLAMLGAANRDPARFPHPDRLDITRRDNRHLAFGTGGRFCLGAQLARMEGQIAISALLSRLPNLRLATDSLEWRKSAEVRGLKTLPVTF